MQRVGNGEGKLSQPTVSGDGDGGNNEELDKISKLAESSGQAVARRSSINDINISARRMSASKNGDNSKGKERASDADEDVKDDMKAGSDAESVYDSDDESLHCAICLSVIDDRTVVQPCCHDAYCFVCILAWTEQSRRCPLCVANIELLVHNIRSEKDYQKHYLPPLLRSDSPPPERSLRELREGARRQLFNRPTHPRFKYAEWRQRNKPAPMPDVDAEDLALEKRKYVYKYGLYVKHVASNRFTRFRDSSSQQVSSTPELKQRLAKWLRRELQVFDGVDLVFLVDYCTNIASQLELRSDSATRLLAEFLGHDQAEHFWHETYSFLRSPYKDIRLYDKAVQYDRPPCKVEEAQEEKAAVPPGRRQARSRSVSSTSERSVSPERTFEQPPRRRDHIPVRRDSMSSRRPPPPRKGGDSYVPNYRKPTREWGSRLGRRDEPRPAERRRRDSLSPRLSNRNEEPSTEARVNGATGRGQYDNARQGQRPAEPLHDSDMEDIISLGDSDEESAPLVTPQDAAATNVISVKSSTGPAALNIRGIASANQGKQNGGSDVDIIKDFGPDLLSRLSATPGGSRQQRYQEQSLRSLGETEKGASNVLIKGRGFRKGTVNGEMHAVLMARLNEEKVKTGASQSIAVETESATSKLEREKQEASLREHVLAVLKQRRQAPAQSQEVAVQDASAMEHVKPERPTVSKPTLSTDKVSRLALLQSRLAAEKAAVSPAPLPDVAAPALPGAQAGKLQGANSAADRMAELKRRLSQQKAQRVQAE